MKPLVRGCATLMHAGTIGGGEAAQTIGDQSEWAHQRLGRELLDRLLGERRLREAGQYRLAVIGGLHSRDERHFLIGAAAGPAARALAAEIGVVGSGS